MSTKPTKNRPRRARSTGKAGVTQPMNGGTRSAPQRVPKRRHSARRHDEEPAIDIAMTATSRWSSVPGLPDKSQVPNKPSRRGLSKDSQEQLQKLAANSRARPQTSVAMPPKLPMRKFLDEEDCMMPATTATPKPLACAYTPRDMSLAHCIVQNRTTKKRTKGLRNIRRPLVGSAEKRRNIVDILDAALESLDVSSAPAMEDAVTVSTF